MIYVSAWTENYSHVSHLCKLTFHGSYSFDNNVDIIMRIIFTCSRPISTC